MDNFHYYFCCLIACGIAKPIAIPVGMAMIFLLKSNNSNGITSTSLDHIKNKFGRIKNKKLIADWPDCLEGKREKGEGEASCCVHGSYCSFSCSFHLLSAAKELTSIFTETAPQKFLIDH